MMQLISDPTLYKAVREEVLQNCVVVDAKTGARSLDVKRMLKLPLLQSLYVEILRLHVSVNVTREVVQEQSLQRYSVPRGALLQAPSQLAHYDEEVWGSRDGEHPASEFWAYRHVAYSDKADACGNLVRHAELSMAGRVGAFFPYGTCSQGPILYTARKPRVMARRQMGTYPHNWYSATNKRHLRRGRHFHLPRSTFCQAGDYLHAGDAAGEV